MADPWGGISSTVYRSKKFRPLSDFDRTVYFYVHTCPHRNAVGLYRLPLLWMADDLDRPPEMCKAAIEKLSNVGLVDYDQDDALIRVRNWEKLNAADGPQEAIGRMLRHFDSAPDHLFTTAAFLTFTQHVLHRALGTAKGGDGWNRTDARTKMEDMIFHRLTAMYLREPKEFAEAMIHANLFGDDKVFESLWHRVSDTQSIPYDIPTRYTDTDLDKDKHTDTDRHRDTDTHTHTDRADPKKRAVGENPPTLPPPKGRRSGGGTETPKPIADTVASIGKCEPCGTKLGYGDCRTCKRIKGKI